MRNPFYVRCYAKQDGDQWVAICIDLCLAAQADCYSEAKSKLEHQINEYVYEALTVDREHARDLLSRKAPISNRIEYWWARICQRFESKPRTQCAFSELVSVPA